jgi:hypothetical protein
VLFVLRTLILRLSLILRNEGPKGAGGGGWGKIHALRGFEDEADREAGCAMPAISSSVMAFWGFIAARTFASSKCDIPKALEKGLAVGGRWLRSGS